MSTVASRLVSGSLASWAVIGITIISQIALVPVYLNYWSVEEYGIWLAIQAIINVLTTIDLGHHTFLGYEFLRLGRDNRREISKYLWSGVFGSIAIGVGQILLITLLIFTDAISLLLGESTLDKKLIETAGIVLIIQGISWLVCTTIVGLMARAVSVFGYFPRTAWQRFIYTIVITLSPLIAVILGADLLGAGIALFAGLILYSVPVYYDLFKVLKREEIHFITPSLTLGYSNFIRSLGVSLRTLFENMRHQGVRLFIAPLSGAAGLAAFSTMRTGANVALQGLNTIINPIMPDLMQFLHRRDQERSEASFATIWIVIVVILAPGVVILQALIEPFYIVWTQGKIPFDQSLFATLSLAVLVFAVAQPAMAVIIGNNLMRPQLSISAMAAVIVVAGIFILIPISGILGAGITLLLAEVLAAFAYLKHAKRWLTEHSLRWPVRSFEIAVTSILITASALIVMIAFPSAKWLTVVVSMTLLAINVWRFWKVLPKFASQRARQFIINFPVIKKYLSNIMA